MNLTHTEKEIISLLPLSTNDVADVLDVSPSTVRTHCQHLADKGFTTEVRDGIRYLVSEPTTNIVTTPKSSRAEITRRGNDFLYKKKKALSKELEAAEPIVADGGLEYNPEHFDIVVNLTDMHVGRKALNEFGGVEFDLDIAEFRVYAITSAVLSEISRLNAIGCPVDTVHVLLGGDTVDGEVIYNHQPFEVELTLDQQIDVAGTILFTVIERLAEAVPSVNVVCQPGNHGEIRLKGTSEQFNADGIVYGQLFKTVKLAGFDNVSFRINESTVFTNFLMRGGKWRGHLRHGDDVMSHIGTSSPQNTWKTHLHNHRFDLAFRGHYHTLSVESIIDKFVIMSPSISPGSDYEESLGVAGGKPGSAYVLVGDDHPLRGVFPLYFDDPVAEKERAADLPPHTLAFDGEGE